MYRFSTLLINMAHRCWSLLARVWCLWNISSQNNEVLEVLHEASWKIINSNHLPLKRLFRLAHKQQQLNNCSRSSTCQYHVQIRVKESCFWLSRISIFNRAWRLLLVIPYLPRILCGQYSFHGSLSSTVCKDGLRHHPSMIFSNPTYKMNFTLRLGWLLPLSNFLLYMNFFYIRSKTLPNL